MSSQGELLLLNQNDCCEQRSTDQYKQQISKVVHMFLPEIQTKSISLSASAQISILLRSESEWAQKRCTGSAPMALQLSDKLVCSSHVLPSTRECALNMIGPNTAKSDGVAHPMNLRTQYHKTVSWNCKRSVALLQTHEENILPYTVKIDSQRAVTTFSRNFQFFAIRKSLNMLEWNFSSIHDTCMSKIVHTNS